MAKFKRYCLKFFLLLFKGYRLLISPRWNGCCRFSPSCSQYAMQAVERHGIVKGCFLAIVRLLKCQPFSLHWGSDPVPAKKLKDKIHKVESV